MQNTERLIHYAPPVKCNEAIEYETKSLEVKEQIFPLIHISKAESYSTLAVAYSKQQSEQDEKCNEHCMKALEIFKQLILIGENIESIWSVFENIAEVYMNQNNLRSGRKYYKKALKYIKRYKPNSHPNVQRIRKIIDALPRRSPIESIIL